MQKKWCILGTVVDTAKNMIYSGNATVLQCIPYGELADLVTSDLSPGERLRIQVVDVTPDMDISKQIASGETHRPVLRGKSAKDVHWYVTSACDMVT